MKPHISGESSVANEFRKSVGEKKLHQVDETSKTSGKQGRLHQTERRRRSHRSEDPIRTLMFLGSWNHT
ncbi:hypothetical protein SESBI_04629 [Sesbania bispinosa]|nr:hypothetical protein SESBI_04629 [Sesbania bispinosa]